MFEPKRVYLSYAPVDREIAAALKAGFSMQVRAKKMEISDVDGFGFVSDMDQERRRHIDAADLVLVCLSNDAFSDPATYSEIKYAMVAMSRGKTVVVPIIARACDLGETPFARMNCLPKGQRPIASPKNSDSIKEVVIAIRTEFFPG